MSREEILEELSRAETVEDFEKLKAQLPRCSDSSDEHRYITSPDVLRAYLVHVVPDIARNTLHDMYYQVLFGKKRVDLAEVFFDYITLQELREENERRFHNHAWNMIVMGFVDVTIFLLDKGLNINFVSNYAGRTSLLSSACCYSKVDIVELLLQRGADVNLPDLRGRTPVAFALMQDDITILDRLIMYGADLFVTNSEGDNIWIYLVYTSPFVKVKEDFFQRLVDMRVPASKKHVESFRNHPFPGDAEKKERMLALITSVQEE
jgi:hypothetical protein